uniref:Peptidoglycan Recognition Protein L2 n=1 Tax=Plautia stali TaxID=106108 RepID=A0A499UA06_PLAST|nr:Peptidoglycan Recognition Protein L2 [Plautia stali]
MITTVSTETDAVGLDKAQGIVIPSSCCETPIGSLTVSHSDGFHIGTKIVADTVTYVTEDNNNKNEKKLLTNNIMIIVVATLLTAILIVIIVRNKSSIDNSGKIPFSDHTTQCPFVDPTTPTSTTSLPTTEEPTTLPPGLEIISYEDWSLNKKIECIKNTNAHTISLEMIDSYNCECSKDYLIAYENKYSLKHNFYISGDGFVYEGFGWNCSSEYNHRYSRSVLKIAFFCLSYSSHTKLLEKLISYGITNDKIHKDYNILPECCRNSDLAIIDNTTMAYLNNEAGRSFKNPNCIDYNKQCVILYNSEKNMSSKMMILLKPI